MPDRERQIPYDLTYTWDLKKAKQKQTHRYRGQTGGDQQGGRRGSL